MNADDAVRLRSVLDRLVREKEIAAQFFGRMATVQEEVEHRRWFRRMAQDEKDQRKILMKHRRELCGHVVVTTAPVLSAIHAAVEPVARTSTAGYLDALRIAARIADESRAFAAVASDLTNERSCRIFLKILSQESGAHRDELLREIRKAEAVGEPVAA
jgi:rubrerythrin